MIEELIEDQEEGKKEDMIEELEGKRQLWEVNQT